MRLQEPTGSGSKQRGRDSECTRWPTSPRPLWPLRPGPVHGHRGRGRSGQGSPRVLGAETGPFLPPGWALRPRVPACVSMDACVPTFVTMSPV